MQVTIETDEDVGTVHVYTIKMVVQPDFTFNGMTGVEALHECLCQAIHEQDPDALSNLSDNVIDIE